MHSFQCNYNGHVLHKVGSRWYCINNVIYWTAIWYFTCVLRLFCCFQLTRKRDWFLFLGLYSICLSGFWDECLCIGLGTQLRHNHGNYFADFVLLVLLDVFMTNLIRAQLFDHWAMELLSSFAPKGQLAALSWRDSLELDLGNVFLLLFITLDKDTYCNSCSEPIFE